MNKHLLLVLLAALVLALGALWWSTVEREHDASSPEPTASAAAPATPSALAELPRQPDATPSLDEDAGAADDEVTRTAARPTQEPTWLELTAVLPNGVPADEEAHFVVRFSPVRASPQGERKELSAPLDPRGRARLELPAGIAEARVDLRAHYLYLEKEVALTAPFTNVEVAPKLGARFTATLRLPQPLPADLERAAPFMGVLRGFEFGVANARNHTLEQALGERERLELGGLRPKLNYLLAIDTQIFAPVHDFELRATPGEHVRREYVVDPGARVLGVALGPDGAPLAEVMVMTEAVGNWMNLSTRSALSGSDGSFDLRGLPAGKLRVIGRREGYLPASSEELDLTAGQSAQVVLRLGAGVSLGGRVSFADGAPAANAEIVCMDAGAERGSGNFRTLKSDADGRFEFRALEGKSFDLRATLSVERALEGEDGAPANAEWSAISRQVTPGGEVVMVLEPPTRARGRVVDTAGRGLPRFSINHRWAGAGRMPSRSADFEDPAGAFEIWLGAGEHLVNATATGFEPVTASGIRVEAPLGGSELTITMRRQAAVTGVVLSPGGAPIEGARVELRGERGGGFGRGGSGGAATRADGSFALEKVSPGSYRLVASAEGFAPSEPRPLVLSEGQEQAGIELALRTGGRIEGVIYDASGAPDVGRMVMVGGFGSGTGEMVGQTTSDASGQFVMEHVAPGTHNVIATPRVDGANANANLAAAMSSLKMTSVEVVEGQTTRVVLGAPPAAPVKLSGRVTRAGQPLSEGVLTAVADGGSMLESLKFATLDGSGSYEVTLDKPGAYTFVVGRRMGDTSAEYFEDIPAVPEFRLDFDLPAGVLRGRVLGADGAPLARVGIRHEREGRFGLSAYTARPVFTEPDGSFAIVDLAPGKYTVRAAGEGFPGASRTWGMSIRTGVEVSESGAAFVEFRLDAPGTISGVVLDGDGRPAPDASVFVRDARGALLNPISNIRTNAQGAFRFESAASGTYTVSARASGAASAESAPVRVSSGEVSEVELRATPATMLVVEIEFASERIVRTDIAVLDEAGRDHGGMLGVDALRNLMTTGASSARRRIGPLPPGKYKVTVTPAEGAPVTKPVSLSGQAERTLKVRLGD